MSKYNHSTKEFIESLDGLSLSDMKVKTLEYIDNVVDCEIDKKIALLKIRQEIETTKTKLRLISTLWNMLLSGEGLKVL